MNPKEISMTGYMKLYTQLREKITRRIYHEGDRLPSKRQLADESGYSVITVEHAYELLAEEGYVEPRERSGYYVIYKEGDSYPVGEGKRSGGACRNGWWWKDGMKGNGICFPFLPLPGP